jgi:hypothetical protein
MAKSFEERLGALCKRLGVELRLDPNGKADPLTLAKIGAALLSQQPEFQLNWNGRGRGRPKGSLKRRREDVIAIQVIERVAKKRGTDFSTVLPKVVQWLENNGHLPVPEERTTNPKRLRRLKSAINDEGRERRDALAEALLRSPSDKK